MLKPLHLQNDMGKTAMNRTNQACKRAERIKLSAYLLDIGSFPCLFLRPFFLLLFPSSLWSSCHIFLFCSHCLSSFFLFISITFRTRFV
ncbi:hypothetical protein BDV41DRAFT_518904 [Aspergillus transmontanensis]|uniref:Uncharacterized protein n=1 Tax=Aspergillus transmontanensis TaxID=1034304 RepID=A0A5N6WGA6_9EURO|nr:hypothetical protein BDV41DRAFT_518904 [Aspergillus transmontanensis]